MATIVNLTPHAIVFRRSVVTGLEALQDITIPTSGRVARVASRPGAVTSRPDLFAGCVVASATIWEDEVDGLPEYQHGVVYIVSALVLGRVRRPDVFAPGTGPNDGAVRDDKGQIIAVTRLICSV